jgi:hypothetical protein
MSGNMKPHYRWNWELNKPEFVAYWYPNMTPLHELAHRAHRQVKVVEYYDCGPFLDSKH